MNDVERRTVNMEWRIDGDEAPVIKGYGAVFNSLSQDLGGFREKIAPGAFARTIKGNNDIVSLFNHESSMLLGRTGAGTLTVREDKTGLFIEVTPPESRMDVVESIRRGDVPGMSFQFVTVRDSWEGLDKKEPIRTLEEVRLMEVGPVVFPAYQDTKVSARALSDALGRRFEDMARTVTADSIEWQDQGATTPSDSEASLESDSQEAHSEESDPEPEHSEDIRTQSIDTIIRRLRIEAEAARKAGIGVSIERD